MKKEEAKQQILRVARKRLPQRPSSPEKLAFYFEYLKKERPDLLKFRSGSGDQWQVVKGWIESELGGS